MIDSCSAKSSRSLREQRKPASRNAGGFSAFWSIAFDRRRVQTTSAHRCQGARAAKSPLPGRVARCPIPGLIGQPRGDPFAAMIGQRNRHAAEQKRRKPASISADGLSLFCLSQIIGRMLAGAFRNFSLREFVLIMVKPIPSVNIDEINEDNSPSERRVEKDIPLSTAKFMMEISHPSVKSALTL